MNAVSPGSNLFPCLWTGWSLYPWKYLWQKISNTLSLKWKILLSRNMPKATDFSYTGVLCQYFTPVIWLTTILRHTDPVNRRIKGSSEVHFTVESVRCRNMQSTLFLRNVASEICVGDFRYERITSQQNLKEKFTGRSLFFIFLCSFQS